MDRFAVESCSSPIHLKGGKVHALGEEQSVATTSGAVVHKVEAF